MCVSLPVSISKPCRQHLSCNDRTVSFLMPIQRKVILILIPIPFFADMCIQSVMEKFCFSPCRRHTDCGPRRSTGQMWQHAAHKIQKPAHTVLLCCRVWSRSTAPCCSPELSGRQKEIIPIQTKSCLINFNLKVDLHPSVYHCHLLHSLKLNGVAATWRLPLTTLQQRSREENNAPV